LHEIRRIQIVAMIMCHLSIGAAGGHRNGIGSGEGSFAVSDKLPGMRLLIEPVIVLTLPIGSTRSPKMKITHERFARKGSEVVDHKSNSLIDNSDFKDPFSNMSDAKIITIAPKAMPTRSRSSRKVARPKETMRWNPSDPVEGKIGVEKEDLTLRERSSPGVKSRVEARRWGSMSPKGHQVHQGSSGFTKNRLLAMC
jgi:hypothetical protein